MPQQGRFRRRPPRRGPQDPHHLGGGPGRVLPLQRRGQLEHLRVDPGAGLPDRRGQRVEPAGPVTADPPVQGVPRIPDLTAERAVVGAARRCPHDLARVASSTSPGPAPGRSAGTGTTPPAAPAAGVSPRPASNALTTVDPDSRRRNRTRQVLPGNDPRDNPDQPAPRVRGNSCCRQHPATGRGQPGERSRPPNDAAATCHAVTGPITPTGPNRPVTAAVAAPTAASRSRHGEPSAFGTAWSTPASRATSSEMHPRRLQPAAHPPQPAAHRRRRHPQRRPDRPVTLPGSPSQQRRADHLGRVRPPQQHRDRQQHMRDQAPPRTGPAAAAATRRPRAPHAAGPTPTAQHPRATRAVDLPARQPRLDPNLICLYRDQRVPPCIQHGPPAAVFPDIRREGRCHVRRQDSSDTGTVTTPTTTDTNTNKINPSSATDLTSPGPVVGVRNDGQQSRRTVIASSPCLIAVETYPRMV